MNEIIDSYKKLPIGKYQELMEVITDQEADEYDKNLAIVSILSDIDTVELYELPIGQFNHLLQNSRFLTESPEKKALKDRYKVGDFVLVPQLSAANMTTAQFIDYQTLVKDGIDRNLVKILSVFLVPEGKMYNRDYDAGEVEKAIRDHLLVEDALALSGFFFLLFRSWYQAILGSLRRQLKRMMKNRKIFKEKEVEELREKIQAFQDAGDGLSW